MQEAKILSPLIGELYDAAIDPTLWEPVLRNVAAFVGRHSAAWWLKMPRPKPVTWRMTTTCCHRTSSDFISKGELAAHQEGANVNSEATLQGDH